MQEIEANELAAVIIISERLLDFSLANIRFSFFGNYSCSSSSSPSATSV
jgi:hypothetical protein